MRPKVIYDTDGGTDDAYALLLALDAHRKKEIDLLAITCVFGNTSLNNVCNNIARVLETAAKGSKIPVYRGAESSLIKPFVVRKSDHYHGVDGFGDVEWETKPDLSVIQTEHAVNALCRLVREYPGQVNLIMVGPLTNGALATKMDPEFLSNLKEIHIMGGNSHAVGNVDIGREFNFYSDPEAAHVVLTNNTKCPLFITPWETCLNKAGSSLDWRCNVLGRLDTPVMNMMNRAEKKMIQQRRYDRWIKCDAVAMLAFLDRSFITESKEHYVTVELHGELTKGLMLLDHLKHIKSTPNATIITNIDIEKLKNAYMRVLAVKG